MRMGIKGLIMWIQIGIMGKRMHADNAEEGGYRFPERPNLARKTP